MPLKISTIVPYYGFHICALEQFNICAPNVPPFHFHSCDPYCFHICALDNFHRQHQLSRDLEEQAEVKETYELHEN